MPIRDHRDLTAWQKAMDIAVTCYQGSEAFPQREVNGLAQQLRRTAVSIPSGIAAGHARRGPSEFVRLLRVSLSALAELETQLEIAERLGYLDPFGAELLRAQSREVGKLLNGLVRSLARKGDAGSGSTAGAAPDR